MLVFKLPCCVPLNSIPISQSRIAHKDQLAQFKLIMPLSLTAAYCASAAREVSRSYLLSSIQLPVLALLCISFL